MYGTFSLIRYSTTRSQPRIFAIAALPFLVAVTRLYDAAQELDGLADTVLERGERRVEPRLRQLGGKRERRLVYRDLGTGQLTLDQSGEVGDGGRGAAQAVGLGAALLGARSLDERARDVAR